jgi:hypothetical protein
MKTIQSWWAWLLGTVVSMLGFSACNNVLDMYGCPPGTYDYLRDEVTVKAEVVNTEGRVVRGCQVVVAPDGFHEGAITEKNDTLYTDFYGRAEGTYKLSMEELKTAEIKFEGAEPDSGYEPQTLQILPLIPRLDNTYHIIDITVELQKKAE